MVHPWSSHACKSRGYHEHGESGGAPLSALPPAALSAPHCTFHNCQNNICSSPSIIRIIFAHFASDDQNKKSCWKCFFTYSSSFRPPTLSSLSSLFHPWQLKKINFTSREESKCSLCTVIWNHTWDMIQLFWYMLRSPHLFFLVKEPYGLFEKAKAP